MSQTGHVLDTSVSVSDTPPTTAPCTCCGEVTRLDDDDRLGRHRRDGGSGDECEGTGQPAGVYTEPAPYAGFRPTKVASARFRNATMWRSMLVCSRCGKCSSLPYATFEPVLMPRHEFREGGKQTTCPGSNARPGRQFFQTRRESNRAAAVLTAVCVGLLVIAYFGLSSCLGGADNGDQEWSGSTAVEPSGRAPGVPSDSSAPSAPPRSVADTLFIATADEYDVQYSSRAEITAMEHAICRQVDGGVDPYDLAATFIADAGWTAPAAGAIVGAAVASYCPEHGDQV